MAAKASGKPVHNTTRTKISQTWLASHTGPMACSISRRRAAPGRRRRLPAAPPRQAEPDTEGQETEAERHHDLERVADDAYRRPVGRRDLVEAVDQRVGVVVGEDRQPLRHTHAEMDAVA